MTEQTIEKQNSDIENGKTENIYEKLKRLYYEGKLEQEKKRVISQIELEEFNETNRFLYSYSYVIPKADKKRLKKALREDGYKCFGVFGKYLCIHSYYVQEKKENKEFTDEEIEQLYNRIKQFLKESAQYGEQEIRLDVNFITELSDKRVKKQLRQMFKKNGLNVYIKETEDSFIIGW